MVAGKTKELTEKDCPVKRRPGARIDPVTFYKRMFDLAKIYRVDREVNGEQLQAMYDALAEEQWDQPEFDKAVRYIRSKSFKFPVIANFMEVPLARNEAAKAR